MQRRFGLAAVGMACLVVAAGCGEHEAEQPPAPETQEITVLCPSIFAGVMKQTIPAFERVRPDCKVKLVVQPIAPMLKEIVAGTTTGDVFLSMGDVELSHLYKAGLVDAASERPIARTSLVVLAAPGNPLGLESLKDIARPEVKHICIPDPEFNSGGRAFIEAAKKIGMYESIQDRLLFAPGPRAGTKLIEKGKAEVAVTHNKCYVGRVKTNALVEAVSADLHEPIVCKAVIVKSSSHPELADEFLEFLRTVETQARFKKALFEPIE